MGMGLETYLQLTPEETLDAYNAWMKQKNDEFSEKSLLQWRIARWQSWVALYPPKLKRASEFDILELRGDDELKEAIKKRKEEEKAKKKKAPMRDARRFRAITQKWPAPKKVG